LKELAESNAPSPMPHSDLYRPGRSVERNHLRCPVPFSSERRLRNWRARQEVRHSRAAKLRYKTRGRQGSELFGRENAKPKENLFLRNVGIRPRRGGMPNPALRAAFPGECLQEPPRAELKRNSLQIPRSEKSRGRETLPYWRNGRAIAVELDG